MVGKLDRSLARRLHAAGVTVVADRGALSSRAQTRLETIADRWSLRLLQPEIVEPGRAAAAAACVDLKRASPGSRCGVRASSASAAASLSQPLADLVVVRAANARAFMRLDDRAGASRMVGVLRLTSRSYREKRWRAPIRAAHRSHQLDLVVQPSGPRWERALRRYLGHVSRLADGDRVPPSQPEGLLVTGTSRTGVELGWRPSRDNTGVTAYGLYRDGALIGSTTQPAATFDALACGAHVLEVDAVDRSGNRSAKSFVTAGPTGCQPAAGDIEIRPAAAPSSLAPRPRADNRAPSAPTDLRRTAATTSSVSLAWSASTDNRAVTGYRVFRDGVQVTTASGTSATIGSLACGRTYTFAVDARDAAGNVSGRATLATSTTTCPAAADTQPPSVPPNQRYTSITRNAVTLAWDGAADNVGVAGYHLYLNGSRVASTQNLSHAYAGLACGTSYTFALEAYDAAGNVSDRAHATGTRSTSACAEPQPDGQAPTVPANVRFTSATQTSVAIAWDASTDDRGVAGYRVFRNGTSIGTTTALSQVASSLTCGTSYTFAVEAYDAAGNTSARGQGTRSTAACDAQPDTQAPTVPANVRFTSATQTSVAIAWDASTDDRGVAGYRVFRNGTSIGTTTALSQVASSLTCGTSYTFAVEAYDAAGNTSARGQGTRSTEACPGPDPEPGPGVANLWIDGNGGTCTRSATPASYSDGAACATAGEAYTIANATSAGSTILIKGGTYNEFRIRGSRSSTNRIVFDAAPGEKPLFRGGYMSLGDGQVQGTGPDYVTLKNLTTAEFGPGHANPDNRFGIFLGQGSSFVRLENMRAGNFLIQASQNIEVIGGEYGPCRASDGHQQCEINKVDHYPGAPQPKNILIDGVHFHDYDLGPSCFTPSNGGTSTGSPDCHWRSMYLNGVHDLTLRNSRFRESFIAPWMTISGPDAARVGNRNILVENNVFGTGVNYGNPGGYTKRGYGRWEAFDFAWCQNASSSVGYENVTFRFNSASRAVGLFVMFNESGCQSKVRNVRSYGNIGYRNGCDALVEYRYNVYSNSGTCNATDRNANAGGSLPFYASDTHSPGPDDYALAGAAAAPDNLVPASMGCPATDHKGRPRGQNGFCDAGAYER